MKYYGVVSVVVAHEAVNFVARVRSPTSPQISSQSPRSGDGRNPLTDSN